MTKRPAGISQWIQRAVADEVGRTTKDGRDTIRAAVEGRIFGMLSKGDATAMIRQVILLNGNQVRSVAALARELEAAGESPDVIFKRGSALAKDMLEKRAMVIAEHELTRAQTAAQHMLWKEWRSEGKLNPQARKLWVAQQDACSLCQDLDGKTAGLDEMFDGRFYGPPEPHVSCKCRIALVGPSQAPRGPEGRWMPREGLTSLKEAFEQMGVRVDMVQPPPVKLEPHIEVHPATIEPTFDVHVAAPEPTVVNVEAAQVHVAAPEVHVAGPDLAPVAAAIEAALGRHLEQFIAALKEVKIEVVVQPRIDIPAPVVNVEAAPQAKKASYKIIRNRDGLVESITKS